MAAQRKLLVLLYALVNTHERISHVINGSDFKRTSNMKLRNKIIRKNFAAYNNIYF